MGFVSLIARKSVGGGYFMHPDVQCFLQASPIGMSCRDMNLPICSPEIAMVSRPGKWTHLCSPSLVGILCGSPAWTRY